MISMAEFGQPQAPQSVEQITKAAQEYEYNAAVPLRSWLRTASAILKEADIYSREGDDETTYFLLFRHAHLVLANLAQHPEAVIKANRTQLRNVEQRVNQNLQILDVLRPRIKERYERYSRLVQEREARRDAQARRDSKRHPSRHDIVYGDISPRSQRLKAHENQELAVQLAQKEFSRRAAARSTNRETTNSEGDDLSQSLQAIRARVEPPYQDQSSTEARQPRPAVTSISSYNYPNIPVKQDHHPTYSELNSDPRPVSYESTPNVFSSPPLVPPKPDLTNSNVPPLPNKVFDQSAERQTTPGNSYTFAPAAYLENGTPLRTVFLPPTLRTTFLRLAYKNTLANLETCAFLAGTLVANAFFVSKLIVPSQTSTSDMCEMTNESDLFDYVDSHDLMILGWIHTHPTQTCFMSSRDLHTHAGYQMMLAESVAIVCAPSKGDTSHGGDWGAYRLTDPPGKRTILNCEKPGIFHPHDVDNVYTDALRPGHVVEAKGLDFEVVDLREP